MNTFKLIVASPDGNIFEGDVTKFDVRGALGELAVMAGHIPFVTSVVPCACTLWFDDDSKKTAKTDGGLLTVKSDSTIFMSGSFKFDE
ncbi:MAG: hypothetical protein IIX73_04700 [Clostridia bacterium]|nr:hypothetical protein [Clostridia bacterium]